MAAQSKRALGRRELLKVLNAALTVEARSALAYGMLVGDTVETGLTEDQWKRMAAIRSQLSKNAGDLATRIYAAGGTPDPGHYPFVATNYNFLNADVMLSRVEPTIPGDIAKLEKLAADHPDGELGELLRGLVATKREQHQVVQAILAELNPAPEPPAEPAGDDAAPAADA